MKKLKTLLILGFLGILSYACSSDAIASKISSNQITASSTLVNKEIQVRSFNKIDVSIGNVTIKVGEPTTTLKISCPDNIMGHIEISSKGSTLRIARKDHVNIRFAHNSKPLSIIVSAPALSHITTSLSAQVNVKGQNIVEEIDLDAATSGSITLENLATGELEANSSTSGHIKINNAKVNGKANIETSTSGSVSIDVTEISGKTKLESTTSGSINIPALITSRLKASASTSGSIRVAGTAANVDFEANTSGHISCADLKAETGSASASTSGSVKCNINSPEEISKSLGGSVKNTK